jgi:hypothetical protein
MVPNNSTKFEIRSQVISGNHWRAHRGMDGRIHIKPNEGYHIIPISTFLSNSHSKFPTISTIFFNSQLHLTILFCLFNSLILQYLPHVTHFPKSLPPNTRFLDPLFENVAYIKKNHIFSVLKTAPYTRKYHFSDTAQNLH